MKIANGWFRSFLAVSVLALMVSACTHPPVKGLIQAHATQGPRPWESLYSVTIKHDGTWVVAGSRGLILVSSDKGKSWKRQSIIDRDLYSLRFSPDEKVAWVVGEDGTIFRSADGGTTWSQQKSPVKDRLLKVAVIDDNSAVAVGSEGAIMYTKDAGQTWNLKRFQDLTFFDVYMNGQTGWTVGEFQTILHTTDGGATWQVQTGGNEKLFQLGPYFSVAFINDQTGYVAGLNGLVNSTNDGGKTWQTSKLPIDRAIYVTTEQSPQSLWLAGAEGTFIHAKLDQASTSWPVVNPTFNDISDVASSGQTEVAVGLSGTLVYSTDGGTHWQLMK